MEDGYKALACAVIEQAIIDLRNTDRSKVGDRMTARAFLRGDKHSILEFWCNTAGIDRAAMQDKLF